MLSSYVNSPAGAGLVIEQMIEPAGRPDDPVWPRAPCLPNARWRLDGLAQAR